MANPSSPMPEVSTSTATSAGQMSRTIGQTLVGIPQFSGKSNENIKEFFSKIAQRARIDAWSEQQTLAVVKYHLTDAMIDFQDDFITLGGEKFPMTEYDNLDASENLCVRGMREEIPKKDSGNLLKKNVVQEVTGELFDASSDCSLVHCVAQDLRMGRGIAVRFKKIFGGIQDLRKQHVKVGNVAVLHKVGSGNLRRDYVYYLVTKKYSSQKPTISALRQALSGLKAHCLQNNVSKLAMPRIGCGLDKLSWQEVKEILNDTFQDSNIQVIVYNLSRRKYTKQQLDSNKDEEDFSRKTVPHKYNEVISPTFDFNGNGVEVETQEKEEYSQETTGNQQLPSLRPIMKTCEYDGIVGRFPVRIKETVDIPPSSEVEREEDSDEDNNDDTNDFRPLIPAETSIPSTSRNQNSNENEDLNETSEAVGHPLETTEEHEHINEEESNNMECPTGELTNEGEIGAGTSHRSPYQTRSRGPVTEHPWVLRKRI
ncbi:uncharacterized protein CBL_09007 [Carabus blaptoides fortunei]